MASVDKIVLERCTGKYQGRFINELMGTFRQATGRDHCPQLSIADDMAESGGGGESVASPEVAASDDDDGGDADSDPDGRPPHKPPSPKPATGSASNQHTGKNRLRARQQAAQNPDFKVIGVDEFSCAASIGMSVEFLRKDRSGKRLIPFFKIGKAIRYSPLRVSEALANLEVGGSVPAPRPKKARQSNLAAG